MSRIPIVHEVPVPIEDPTLDQSKINGAMTALREQGLAAQQHDSAVRAVALQLGYQLPADCTDPDLIQRDISANMRRSVEACLEVGKALCVLKETCEFGNFIARLKVLNLDERVARRFMSAAIKFSKRVTSPVLEAIGSQSKLFELLVLDDDEVKELAEGGTVRGVNLDSIDEMGVRELRSALRKSNAEIAEHVAEKAATEKLLAHKNAKIDEYSRQIERATPDDVLAGLHRELSDIMSEAVVAVQGQLRQGFVAVTRHHESHGGDSRQVLSGYVAQLQQHLHALRDEFMLESGVSDADGIPAWQKWANEQDSTIASPNLAA